MPRRAISAKRAPTPVSGAACCAAAAGGAEIRIMFLRTVRAELVEAPKLRATVRLKNFRSARINPATWSVCLDESAASRSAVRKRIHHEGIFDRLYGTRNDRDASLGPASGRRSWRIVGRRPVRRARGDYLRRPV